jgi:hypothetical protein
MRTHFAGILALLWFKDASGRCRSGASECAPLTVLLCTISGGPDRDANCWETPTTDIFISYAAPSEKIAKALAGALESNERRTLE